MTKPRNEILVRLEQTINKWNNEVSTAQQQLTRQISDTRGQLGALLQVLAEDSDVAQDKTKQVVETEQKLQATVEALEAAEAAQAEATARIAMIEADATRQATARAAQVEGLEEQVANLRAQLEGARSQAQDQERLRADLSHAESKLHLSQEEREALRADLEGLRETTSQQEQGAAALREEIRALTELSDQRAAAVSAAEAALEAAKAFGQQEREAKAVLEEELASLRAVAQEKEALEARIDSLMLERDDARTEAAAHQAALGQEQEARTTQVAALELDLANARQELVDAQTRLEESAQNAQASEAQRSALEQEKRQAEEALEKARDHALQQEERAAKAVADRAEDRRIAEDADQRLESMQEQVDAVRTQEYALSEELKEARQQLTVARAESDALSSQDAETQQRLSYLEETLKSTQEDLESARGREATARDLATELTAAAEAAKTQYALSTERLSEMERDLLDTQARQTEAEADREQLQTELDELRGRHTATTHAFDEARQAQAEKAEQLRLLREKEVETIQTIADLREEVESLTRDMASAREQLLQSEAQRQDLAVEFESLRAYHDSGEATLKEARDKAAFLEESVNTRDELLRKAEQEAAEYREEVRSLQEQVAELRSRWDSEEAARQTLAQELGGAREHESDLHHTNETLRAQVEELNAKLKENEKIVRLATQEMAYYEDNVKVFQDQITGLQAEKARAHALHEAAERDSQALAARLHQAEVERDTLRNQQERISSSTAVLLPSSMASGDMSLPESIDAAVSQLDALRTAFADQARELRGTKKLLNQSLTARDSLEQELSELQAKQRAKRFAARKDTGDADTEAEAEALDRVVQAAFDSHGRQRHMGEILVNAGVITREQLATALEDQKTTKQRRLGALLVEKGYAREEVVAQALACQLKIPFVRLSETRIDNHALRLVNSQLATHHMCMPVRSTGDTLVVAMANPLDAHAIDDLELASALSVEPVVTTLSDITASIVRYYGIR